MLNNLTFIKTNMPTTSINIDNMLKYKITMQLYSFINHKLADTSVLKTILKDNMDTTFLFEKNYFMNLIPYIYT